MIGPEGRSGRRLDAGAAAGRIGRRLEAGVSAGRQMASRALGVPALIAIGLSSVGASIYFGLGVVAESALGLTPLAYLLAGVFFVLTVMTYVEGNSVHPERGGASTFARYALNELWSFVAGWAILLDYLIVMAIGAFVVPHYLAAFWPGAGGVVVEHVVVGAVLAFVAWTNIRGISADRLRIVLRAGLTLVVVTAAVVIAALASAWDPGAITGSLAGGDAPGAEDVVFAAVIAAAAMVGIESASGLAGEIRVGGGALGRVVAVSALIVPAMLVGVGLVAPMAAPVVDGATELGTRWVAAPVLGVVAAVEPGWLMNALRAAVASVGAVVLVLAVQGNMLGLSRLGYSLATNRQIPSLVGRLHSERSTPFVLVTIASLIAFGLTLTSDIELLAGLFAFGAMLALTIAHLSIVVMRFREPDAPRAFRLPLSIPLGRGSIPLTAALGAVAGAAAWVSVLVLHEGARVAGGAWMLFGLGLYVTYRTSQGKSLGKRFVIPEESLREAPDVEYGSILVPVFGEELDDDIMGTAGRLASEELDDGEGAVIEALYVFEIPMSVPIDVRVPDDRFRTAKRALARAKEVGEEYEGVHVATAIVRGRTIGQTIVEEARRRGAELIVLAAEEPTRVRGGTLLGGRGGPRDRVVGKMTRYVLEKAPCRVILTAPPASAGAPREGVAP